MKTKTMNKIALALGIIVVLPFAGMQLYEPEPLMRMEVECPFAIIDETHSVEINDTVEWHGATVIDLCHNEKCHGHVVIVR